MVVRSKGKQYLGQYTRVILFEHFAALFGLNSYLIYYVYSYNGENDFEKYLLY